MIGMKDVRMPSAGSYNTVRTAEIIQLFPSRSNRVLAMLDNRSNRKTGISFLPKKKRYVFSAGK
ncbi:MAG: hypothetical protein ACYS91_16920 [Planctomycetota bacterium]|jgi:hypothetical protein